MDERPTDSAPEPTHHGHHVSARERQRRGPMWGCLKAIAIGAIAALALLVIIVGGGYWYLGSASFADLVRLRIESTLANRLGRTVSIGSVRIVTARPQRVILNDLRIANAPGGVNKYFATVRQVEITGGVESFWGRDIRVSRVEIRDPQLNFEIFPAGAPLVHNFPHWNAGPKSRYEIVHLTIGTLHATGGAMNFLDRRHDIAATTVGLTSVVNISRAGDVYEGVATSPRLSIRIQDYVPIDLDLRGGFRYTPGVLALNSIALRGRGIDAFLSGKIAPLSEGAYNFSVRSNVGLDRVREIFRIAKVLQGGIVTDLNLRGKGGAFSLTGGWASPKIGADVYDLTNAKGRLDVNGDRTIVDVATARYGGGTITAHYLLPEYSEPYPMSVDLRYNGVSLEKLFSDWGIKDTGLRGAATGTLAYHWNKDKILEGAGDGKATLAKTTMAFSHAKYPIPLGGSADFALDNGVVKFKRAALDTGATHVDFSGSLRIEDVSTDLALKIHSGDFSELDRIGYNFARSAGKNKYELLGLGGAGDITGTVKGKLKEPEVVAHIAGTQTRFNNALLGDSDIDLRYDGVKGVLTFDRAVFAEGGGRLALTGTIAFPDRGPSPRFDLAIDASGYPVDEAIKVVTLPFKGIHGIGTGRMVITGTPDEGRVTFANLVIAQGAASQLHLKGDVQWFPGKGNSRFNLDIAARDFPVSDIVEFLDLGTMPVKGQLTGTLHLEGPKTNLQGAGAITVRNGSIYGEPVTQASAEINFMQGAIKATNVVVTSPAGKITGEAELNLNTNKFSYTIQSASIDLSKITLLQSLAGLLGGTVSIQSSGAGTFNQPELVATITLNQATVKGLALPAGTPPPQIYVAIRNGQLIVRGSIGDIITIDGNGTIGANFAVNGLVKIVVADLAKAAALFPSTATLPISGRLEADLQLGGSFTSLEAIRIDATVPVFDVRLSDHEFTAAAPIHMELREGRFTIDEFAVQHPGATFTLGGFAELAGAKRLHLVMRGGVEAALAQLFTPGLRAEGHIAVDATVNGTLSDPQINGTAEMEDAQFRFSGFPQIIDHVRGTVDFATDTVKVQLQAVVGGGTVVVGGSIGLTGFKPQSLNLAFTGTDVSLRYFEGLSLGGNFKLGLNGDLDRMTLRGDVTVNRALYFRNFDFGTALLNVLLSRRSVTPVVSASWQDHVSLDLHVVTQQDALAIRNNIADVTGSGNLDVRGTLANPTVLGAITLDEGGRVRLQNVDYRLVSGSISFQNPFRIDPYFDITLQGRVSSVGYSEFDQGGPIDVTVNLTGTIDRFTPTITSDPPASDITLFSLLGFGGITGKTPTGMTQTSPTQFGQLGYSLLAQSVLRALPFASSFSYDPGLLDTTDDPGAKVIFQRQVSNNVRVLAIYNLRSSKRRTLVEWQVSPDWTLQFTRDEVRSEYRAEARFRRQYAGHWTWGGHGRPVTLSTSFGPLAGTAPAAQSPPDTAAPAGSGPMVTRITYRADATFDTSLLARYEAVRVGQPLSIRAVQASVKNLFATGDFRDVQVETTADGLGVAVTFVLSLNYRVAEIHFDGLSGKQRDRADRELTTHVGDVLSLNAVDRSADAVEQGLKDSGYLEATVDPETQFQRERSRAVIIFHVATGPQAKIATVNIEGDVTPFTQATLVKQMRERPGRTFDARDARTDATAMRRYMIRRDYRKADVRYLGDTYDKASKTVTLRYSATAGPKVRVEVTGVSHGAVRSVLPFRRNQPYSEDAIDTAAEDITTLYQQRGYYNAAVDTDSHLDAATNTWTTTFNVRPGQHFRLTAVDFAGNVQITDKQLRDVVTTAPEVGIRSFFTSFFHRSGVTTAQLGADRDAVESFYRLNGFSDAQIGTPTVHTDAASGTMTVTFPITEGPQTIVRSVKVEGNEQVPARDLPALQLKAGGPLNPALLRNDMVDLQSFYADRGNAEVQITPRTDISADKTGANVTYVIAEGPKIHLGDVVVRGNTYTKSSVILREAELKKGQPFSYTSLLEAQRNLYRLGIFQRAEIQPEQAGTTVDQRNVVIQVEEGKDLALSGSLGGTKTISGGGSGFLGSASIANRNLFGTGRYLGLELVGSTPSASGGRREAYLTYREPFLGPYNVPVQFTVFQSDEHRPQAHIRQRGLSIEATKITRFETRWSVRYEYRIGDCLIENPGDLCYVASQALIPGVDRAISNIRIADIAPTFFWDKRDDPIDPHRGFFTTATAEYAFPAFAAHAQFFKEYGQASYYLPLSARSVFAVSTRLGLIQALGNSASEDCTKTDSCIPLTERFTGGGESSHRAYALDLLGDLCEPARPGCSATLVRLIDPKTGEPTGPIAPIGGRGLFITNLEYRFPIFSSVGGALFTDIGNVFAASTIDLNDLRYGVGAGVRYLSPVGPLRFDIGYKLHRRSYEKPFAYFLTLGYAF